MSDGNGSAAPSVWSTDLRRVFREVEGKPVFGMLVAADNKRSEEREERLTQATASIPSAIFWFLLATLVITVTALGVCIPARTTAARSSPWSSSPPCSPPPCASSVTSTAPSAASST